MSIAPVASQQGDDADTNLETLCEQCQEVEWSKVPDMNSQTLTLEQEYMRIFSEECQDVEWSNIPDLNSETSTIEEISMRFFSKERRADLIKSSCPVCRLVGHLTDPQIPEGKELDINISGRKGLGLRLNDRGEKTPTAELTVHSYVHGEKSFYKRVMLAHRFKNNEDVWIRNLEPSGVNYNFLNQQLKNCSAKHTQCKYSEKAVDGLLVIDVENPESGADRAPRGCEYIALSYVLGGYKKKESEGNSIEYSPVVKDAIAVTKRLNCRYLWVDQYCINQKNESHRRQMILQMDQIYANAYATIIAAFGNSADDQLPGVGGPPRYQGRVVIGETQLVELSTTGSDTLKLSKWATRGWTFQEGFLSKRRLIFMKDEVFFLCNKHFAKETEIQYGIDRYEMMNVQHRFSQAGQPNIHSIHVMDSFRWMMPHEEGTDLLTFVEHLIGAYSERNLTEDDDSLDAFLGVLKHYESNIKESVSHFWGIPLKHVNQKLYFDLMWKSDSILKRRSALPSWSWSGWGGPIRFFPMKSSCLQIEHRMVDNSGPAEGTKFDPSLIKSMVRILVNHEKKLIDLPVFIASRLPSKVEEENPKELSIASFTVQLQFCETSVAQLIGRRRSDTDSSEGSVTLLKLAISPEVFLGVPVVFNRDYDAKSQQLGLVLPTTCEFSKGCIYYIIILHAIENRKYERAGIVCLHYIADEGVTHYSDEGYVYLDQENQPIEGSKPGQDKRAENKHLFLENAEWRTICLV